MTDPKSHLCGPWGGQYWYDLEAELPVPFSAWLEVSGDQLSGTILEPNTFVLGGPEDLEAKIRGETHRATVLFYKTYIGIDQPPVVYDGKLSDYGTRIRGHWYFREPLDVAGAFEMTRLTAKTALSVDTAVSAGR